MESAISIKKTTINDTVGFFKTVFDFEEDSKSEIANMVQYVILAIIPTIIILKAVKYAIPEEDDSKGSLEIFVEIISQMAFIVIAMYLSNKAIKYVPTYSGTKYIGSNDLSVLLLPFVILLLTMQTKIGTKVNILFDRAVQLWQGTTDASSGNAKPPTVKLSQPLAGQHYASRADSIDTNQLLPHVPSPSTQMPSQGPDTNQMYRAQPTPMPGSASPGNMDYSEPDAANNGGGNFGSW